MDDKLTDLSNAAISALSTVIPTPEEGYVDTGGASMLGSDIRRAIQETAQGVAQAAREPVETPDRESVRVIVDEYRLPTGQSLSDCFSKQVLSDLCGHIAAEIKVWMDPLTGIAEDE